MTELRGEAYRPYRWRAAIAAILALLALAAFATAHPFFGIAALLFWLGVPWLAGVLGPRTVHVRVHEGQLRVDERVVWRRDAGESITVCGPESSPRLRVGKGLATVEVALASQPEALQVLDELGACRLRFRTDGGAWVGVVFAGAMLATIAPIWWTAGAGAARIALHTLLPLLFYLVILVTQRVLSVGSDGVALEWRWFGRRWRRHAPYAAVHWSGRAGVQLGSRTDVSVTEAASVAKRAIETHKRKHDVRERLPTNSVEALEPEAECAAWLARLQAMAIDPVGYRSVALDTETLIAIAADPDVAVAQRAAAAYVLRLRVPEEATQRIRVGSSSWTNHEHRELFDALAEQPLEQVEETLRALSVRREQ